MDPFLDINISLFWIIPLSIGKGDPDQLIAKDTEGGDALKDWKSVSSLKLLNLVYDLTPGEFIMMVITEVGMVPPTSVPVILREYRKDLQVD